MRLCSSFQLVQLNRDDGKYDMREMAQIHHQLLANPDKAGVGCKLSFTSVYGINLHFGGKFDLYRLLAVEQGMVAPVDANTKNIIL